MYDQSKVFELIWFAQVDAGSSVIDGYSGDGDWTRLFSDMWEQNVSLQFRSRPKLPLQGRSSRPHE